MGESPCRFESCHPHRHGSPTGRRHSVQNRNSAGSNPVRGIFSRGGEPTVGSLGPVANRLASKGVQEFDSPRLRHALQPASLRRRYPSGHGNRFENGRPVLSRFASSSLAASSNPAERQADRRRHPT